MDTGWCCFGHLQNPSWRSRAALERPKWQSATVYSQNLHLPAWLSPACLLQSLGSITTGLCSAVSRRRRHASIRLLPVTLWDLLCSAAGLLACMLLSPTSDDCQDTPCNVAQLLASKLPSPHSIATCTLSDIWWISGMCTAVQSRLVGPLPGL